MREYKIDILGISECRQTGAGRTRLTIKTGETVLHAGEEDIHQGGVTLMLTPEAVKSLMEWTVSSRITSARFYSKYKTFSMIHVYAPTNDA